MFRTEGVQVALVDAGNHVALHPITLGRDYGNAVEVVAGLTGSERIIINPPDSIEAGATVAWRKAISRDGQAGLKTCPTAAEGRRV